MYVLNFVHVCLFCIDLGMSETKDFYKCSFNFGPSLLIKDTSNKKALIRRRKKEKKLNKKWNVLITKTKQRKISDKLHSCVALAESIVHAKIRAKFFIIYCD